MVYLLAYTPATVIRRLVHIVKRKDGNIEVRYIDHAIQYIHTYTGKTCCVPSGSNSGSFCSTYNTGGWNKRNSAVYGA